MTRRIWNCAAVLLLGVLTITTPVHGAEAPRSAALTTKLEQLVAARAVENIINRYEILLGQGYVTEAYKLFSRAPDVQADVGFGLYYGPAGMERLFINLHGDLVGDQAKGGAKPGAFYVLENTTGVVEVAQDLRTARGMWFGAAFSTPGSPKDGFSARYGMARRAVDFIFEDGEWKIWHYFVYGMLYAPVGMSYTDPAVWHENARIEFHFTPDKQADAPPSPGVGPKNTWRPDGPLFAVKPPVPYRTFSETDSYAIRK